MKNYHVIFLLLVSLFFSGSGRGAGDAVVLDVTLELVNETGEDIRISTSMFFHFMDGGDSLPLERDHKGEPDIFSILKGSKKVLAWQFGLYPYPIQGNVFIRSFDEISFYHPGAEEPFRTYGYSHSSYKGELEDGFGQDPDDTQFFYGPNAHKITEQLFIPSDDRPFYLERDEDDSMAARIVITKVPDPS